MKLFGQVAQEARGRRGRRGGSVVIGAVSPISAGRGDGAIFSASNLLLSHY